jgi:phospholipase A-2-activating protein
MKIWDSDYNCIKTITTTSYIRGLSVVPEVGFLSCGSNEALQLWSYDGELLYDLRGHKDTVYSATSLPSGEIVSSSEDCSVIIWNGTEVAQSLATPSGVWSVAALDNGDIIAACQDKMIRVFTRDASRFISDELLAKYTEDVMVAAEAAAEAAKPQRHNVAGVEYDHVIQVDIAEGQPTIPLGYNDGEQAVDAAERFINQNNISPMYLDQITQFIQNAMGEQRFAQGQAAQGPYIDPFRDTAVPAQFGTNQIPSSVPANNRSSPAATPPAKKEAFPIIPPIIVEAGQSAQIITKLKQLNGTFGPEESASVLQDSELALFDTLASKISPTTLGSQTAVFSTAEVKNVQTALQKWPASKRFPILDLARLAILYPDFANQSRETLLPLVRPDLESTDAPLSQLMALRVFVNAFKWKILQPSLESLAESVMETLSALITSTANASIPSLAVSLLRNYATQLSTTKNEARIQILSVALEDILLNESAAPSILYLGLYSIGSLLSRDAQLILTAQGMGIQDATQVYSSSSDANVKQAASDLAKLFNTGVGK